MADFLFGAPIILYAIASGRKHFKWKEASQCEVFLSFSDEGALKNFAGSLYKGMVDARISVFRNDYWLFRDEEIVFQAIKSSKISIPILSPKYASRRWCLNELVQIMKCKNDNSGHIVLPIFYEVGPADISCKIDYCDPEVMKEWERALREVRSLESGITADRDGGQSVKSVIQKVLVELKKAFELVIAENPVGIESPVEKIMKFVEYGHGSTLYVGIYGEGGVGKTTLAKVIYNKLSNRFDHCSLIPNIKESCECKGIEYLRNQLISDLLETNTVYDKDAGTGITFISSKFKGKKVLILLDDVNANDQLEALAGDRNWFAPGSRIIVTTRDRSVLDWAKVDYLHEHQEMDGGGAEILFARHAFRRDSIPGEFLIDFPDVVSAVPRLPLILKVIGSYLIGKSRDPWESTREKLQELRGVQESRESRESRELPGLQQQLQESQQQLQELPQQLQESRLQFQESRLQWQELRRQWQELRRQFQELRRQFQELLRQFQELRWQWRQLRQQLQQLPKQLQESQELHQLQQQWQELQELQELHQLQEQEQQLYRLQEQELHQLQEQLQEQELREQELHQLQQKLQEQELQFLEELKGRQSFLEPQVSQLVQKLQKLRQMEVQEILKIVYDALEPEQKKIFLDIACFLAGSDARIASYMWDASDSHRVPRIEELRFMSLINIGDNHELRMHDELRNLGKSIVREGDGNELDQGSRLWEYEEALEVLRENTGTENIQALFLSKNNLEPGQNYTYEKLKGLVGLRFLHVSDASFEGDLKNMFSKLRWLRWERCLEIPEAENFGVEKLAVLDLSGVMIGDAWKGWNSITSARKLKVLNLTGCRSLQKTFFLSYFKDLEILILKNCGGLKEILPSIGDLKTLVSLDLSGCTSLQKLPEELGNLEGLKELLLDRTNIQEIPPCIGSLKKLEILSAKDCKYLRQFLGSISHQVNSPTTAASDSPLPDSSGSLVKLRRLSLQSRSQLRLIPNSICQLESLAELVLANTMIGELPESIENLRNLEILNISSTNMKKLPNAIERLRKLRELDASRCRLLREVISSICDLSSLQHLNLIGCRELPSLPKLPSNLTVVGVTCKSKELPSLSHLIHLKHLRLHDCESLERIPELPPTLLELEVVGCEKLQLKRCKVSLERLNIIRCKSVKELDLSNLKDLRVLNARNCINIQEIRGLNRLNDLKSLTIQGHPPIELDEPVLSPRNGHAT